MGQGDWEDCLVSLVGWRDQEKEKVVKSLSVFLSLLTFLLYPGIAWERVAGKNRSSSKSEIKARQKTCLGWRQKCLFNIGS